ncbi:helix-turn-helix domain-containing protein [Streptomyces sp. NPDC001635]
MNRTPMGPLGAAGNNVRRNVIRLRERRGWTYRDVEERLAQAGRAIPTVELGWVEAGERPVDVDDLMALAVVFDLGVEELLQPPADCANCHGAPPNGFMCMECETSGLPILGS